MKKQYLKWCAVCLCVLAAGLCYSCGGNFGSSEAGETLLLAETAAGSGEYLPAGADVSLGPEPSGAPEASDGGGGETETGPGSISGTDQTESPAPVCYVHICGEVCRPGVYELAEGSRIFQVLEMAGGFTEEAAVSYLNLAQEISDGMKIVVPSVSEAEAQEAGSQADFSAGVYEETAPAAAGMSADSRDASGGKVNLNTADKAALMTLPGIGEAKADAILRYRQEHGPFEKIEDIMLVPGIKEAAFEKMRDDITV